MKKTRQTGFLLLLVTVMACTKSKTDYEAEINTVVTVYDTYQTTATVSDDDYTVYVQSLNGSLHKGYNEIHLKFIQTQTKQAVTPSTIEIQPVKKGPNIQDSTCPHTDKDWTYNADSGYYTGYMVFTGATDSMGSWELPLAWKIEGKNYSANTVLNVQEQSNKNLNMTAFTGSDGNAYLIALTAPQKPEVGENVLVAGIYFYNEATAAYAVAPNYTLEIDPRMPEPSMGNHSSPNNQNLTMQTDSLYHGIVNYTMTGNWTLNFILRNAAGNLVKGTTVPTTFTPGVEGVKSELYIDILF